MEFSVAEIQFQIDNAELYALGLNENKLSWCLTVRAIEKEVKGEIWRPIVDTAALFSVGVGELSHWNQLPDRIIEWKTGLENGDEKGFLYIFEHSIIENCRIELRTLKLNEFSLKWKGTADIYAGGFTSGVPFNIVSPVEFTSIRFGKLSELECRKRAKRFFPSAEFSFQNAPYSCLIPKL